MHSKTHWFQFMEDSFMALGKRFNLIMGVVMKLTSKFFQKLPNSLCVQCTPDYFFSAMHELRRLAA